MTEQQTLEATPEQTRQEQPEPIVPVRAGAPRKIVWLVVSLVLAVGAVAIWRVYFAASGLPDNIITLSGRIEGDDSAVAAKTSGRILDIRIREGDTVKSGETIAVLDDEQIRSREQQARVAVLGTEARAKSARDQIAVLQEQLQQNQLQTEQASVDAQGRVGQAEADVAAAEAGLAQQEASYQLAVFDKDAYTRLAQSGAVSERQGKQAVATADQQAAAVSAAKRRVEAARGALTTAKANLANAGIRGAQAAAVRKQIAQQQSEIASAMANAEQARAQLVEAQANLRDLTVRAPFDGTVMTRTAEPGEVVQAGTAVVTLLDLSKVYLRGFVPEGQIGRVKIGQPARVYLDSTPDQPVEAYVLRIDPQATFTPENTYFQDDRVKQVVGVKLQLKGATGFAKPGMPSDAEILAVGDTWPTTSRKK
jgi:HlyD family secretion protein